MAIYKEMSLLSNNSTIFVILPDPIQACVKIFSSSSNLQIVPKGF